jgi:protein arginine kinase activator
MFCEDCEKRPANVHITKIVNGHKIEKHICEQCAKKQQDVVGFTLFPDFSFPNIFSSMLEMEHFNPPNNIKEIKCEKCSMTYSQFSKIGRFGCDRCYELFANGLDHLLKRIQGNAQHIGKIPRRAGKAIRFKNELEKAKLELQKAVLNEEYEKAAELRDKIKEMEKKKRLMGRAETNDQEIN